MGGRGMRRTRRRGRRRRRRRILLVGGLVAFGAYKFSQRDADRIEEHTGVPPEEMTDEELEQAADDLGIEIQKRTADDQEQGAGESSVSEEIEELTKLAELHDAGVITDDEFQEKKRQILDLD